MAGLPMPSMVAAKRAAKRVVEGEAGRAWRLFLRRLAEVRAEKRRARRGR